jgi:hypothetical protein|tara:strand:+ start:3234 stop:3743 length:510 start_codon:yes stop_codon:yes gene_type:complete
MIKETLSELDFYHGSVKLPKGISLDMESFRADILYYSSTDKPFPMSRNLDILHTYISDYFNLNFVRHLIIRDTFGLIIQPNEQTPTIVEADPMDLINAPDYVMLYGVKVKEESCPVTIEFDDKRQKNRWYKRKLKTNSFMIFPSTLTYKIEKNESSDTNYIMKCTYESK